MAVCHYKNLLYFRYKILSEIIKNKFNTNKIIRVLLLIVNQINIMKKNQKNKKIFCPELFFKIKMLY